MSEPFSSLLLHQPEEPVVLPGAATFDANAVPQGAWPSEFGGGARASILGEPLTTDRWALQWHVPLGSVSPPRCILVGSERLIVTGLDRRGVWQSDGTWVDAVPVARGVGFVDAGAARYFCDDGNGLARKSERGIFYGFHPIGGIVRHNDAHARMAATASGPVIATVEGVRFCDWQLRTLHEVFVPLYPLTLSTDGKR